MTQPLCHNGLQWHSVLDLNEQRVNEVVAAFNDLHIHNTQDLH